ncbi:MULTISPECIES: type II toxin-antitoxin system HicB family antitoxin [unclassified Thioalkalivibrio]|uniref:type II toxin-antitoxin system HicB family antitoxin n=1 Tax=unclassified Thioalkalivibrio TaxID=2621013 RepID=UPI0003665D81|nr:MULTISPECIES: type II toxin-antitoxin system HicB family antitoxin [unclassified Thioalkalivibrio]
MQHPSYPVRLSRDVDGRYLATCRDVPEALTDGASEAEALREMIDALCVAIAGYRHAGRDLPTPTRAQEGETVVRVAVD